MLDGLRAASQNWFGRIIVGIMMSFIILSFVVWGIGDIFRGFGSNRLANVGSAEITTDAFRTAYQSELQRLQRSSRRVITNDEARAAGLDRQILAKLTADSTLDQKAAGFGLDISDEELAKNIAADPAFKNAAGKFDRQKFNDLLRDNGYSEPGFVREQRSLILRVQIGEAVSGAMNAPSALLEAIHRFQNERRSLDLLVLTESNISASEAPTLEALQTFFDARRTAFRTPEYRQLSVLALTPSSIAKTDEVSDADAKAVYDQVKTERFSFPERRTLLQIVFPDEAAANAASASIASKTSSFDDVAASLNISEKNRDIGTLTKASMIDKVVAEAAFSLAEGEVSTPVKGAFGFTMIKVAKILPAETQTFEDVAPGLKKEIAIRRASSQIQDMRDRIEDQRTSGKPLAEAAKALGLTVRDIGAIDQRGRARSGAEVSGLEDKDALLKAVFASDKGVDNEPIATRNGGVEWFEIVAVEPAREQTLEEVRPEVLVAWQADESARRLSDKAAELVKRLQAGETIEKLAEELKPAILRHVNDVKRSGGGDLSPSEIVQVFNTPLGGAGSVAGVGQTRTVFKVLDSVVPPYDPAAPEALALAKQVRGSIASEVLAQYISAAQEELGVKINDAALRLATGGEANP